MKRTRAATAAGSGRGPAAWTEAEDIRAHVQKLWDRGVLLACLAGADSPFPVRITCKGPASSDRGELYGELRAWIERLRAAEKKGAFRLEMELKRDSVLGRNEFPKAAVIPSLDEALALVGKQKEARAFAAIVQETQERHPELVPHLQKKPLQVLGLAEVWSGLLHVVDYLLAHPRPGLYLRQMDVPGVHTKLVEQHKGVLSVLLDMTLPADAVQDAKSGGIEGFCQRYGFREKPLRVRFRLLDQSLSAQLHGFTDVTLTSSEFASLALRPAHVFMTENEINFLTFPNVPNSMVIFGGGYGFENLAAVPWLAEARIHYWGDLDTHGFCILHELREVLPQTQSFLMDEATLLAHKAFWGREPQPRVCDLGSLTGEERVVYQGLCQNTWGDQVRLEQEHIGFGFVEKAIGKIAGPTE